MPLYDHFRPPWSVQRPWEGFHRAWATAIAFHLNNSGVLPADYFALPMLEAAGLLEVDFEVQLQRDRGALQLRAAIELVSPSNKDRPATRRVFADKCAGLPSPRRVRDRHRHRNGAAGQPSCRDFAGHRTPGRAALAVADATLCGGLPERSWGERPRLEMWPTALTLGAPLPELSLWLELDLSVPLRLEESYTVTCGSLRMRGRNTDGSG